MDLSQLSTYVIQMGKKCEKLNRFINKRVLLERLNEVLLVGEISIMMFCMTSIQTTSQSDINALSFLKDFFSKDKIFESNEKDKIEHFENIVINTQKEVKYNVKKFK